MPLSLNQYGTSLVTKYSGFVTMKDYSQTIINFSDAKRAIAVHSLHVKQLNPTRNEILF